ncbi:aldo/keto reductase [Hydrogenophaga sp.]|uniref:aldo/keto reductase n=1 Tax=Hydrogenophaga sp. TaxID=1904254 RepID=UPI0027195751|nr:aldo/keto reductase [Hydrogenophaga sp.]MDO9436271.1 aldo/keto reductase [Hydrogenophaga sp.]
MSTPQGNVVLSHGARIPALGYGTSPLVGAPCRAAVECALKAGYRHLDTSANSGNEDAVGEGVRQSGVPREDLFITTKVWRTELRDGALQRSAQASLQRLGMAQVDLLLVHWPNAEISLVEVMRALASARRAGLARHIGVANFPSTMFLQAVDACPEPLVANQCEYHPRLNQDAVLAAVRSTGAAFISYSPLGRGVPIQGPVLTEIAARHQRSEAQVLLRWNIQQPQVCAMPRSSHPLRIAQNIAVFDFELSAQDMQALSAMASADGRMVNPPFAPAWDAPRTAAHMSAPC